MGFELTILGSGTCSLTLNRSMASYHLFLDGEAALVDIGAGSLRRMLESGLDYKSIETIFISHFHIDHIADFVPFLWATKYAPGKARKSGLRVIGPPGLKAWHEKLAAVHGEWLLEMPFEMTFEEVEDQRFRFQNIEVETLPMYHSIPVNGYRFETESGVFVFTGDTGYGENVIELSRDADLLLIECAFPDQAPAMDTHLRPSQVGKIASACHAKRVVLTHLYPECEEIDVVVQCKQEFSGVVEIAEDRKKYYLK